MIRSIFLNYYGLWEKFSHQVDNAFFTTVVHFASFMGNLSFIEYVLLFVSQSNNGG